MNPDDRGREPNFPKSFGKYKLLERIAVGGMADIFKAKTSGIGGFEKVLVIKRLHDRLSEDDDFIEMMIDEAKIAVRLNHPNIAKIFDLGCINGKYFIAMEYLEGPDVARLMRWGEQQGRALPIPAILQLGSEVCAGLHYAHTRKDAEGRPMEIVHRDISPPNIMISVEGEVKIVDFGIAKARKRVQDTRHGIIKGKFHYMAPEQGQGRAVDARTDVFSIGMVLYEMLTGRNPYDGVPESELLKTVRMARIPPLRQHRSGLDRELDHIVMRALQRNPKKRWKSAQQFEEALREYRDRKSEAFDRRRMADWVGPIWKNVDREGSERVDRTSLMTEFEYEASDESVIFEAPAEGNGNAGGGSGSENPFDEDAPTEVWDGPSPSARRQRKPGVPQGPGGASGPSNAGPQRGGSASRGQANGGGAPRSDRGGGGPAASGPRSASSKGSAGPKSIPQSRRSGHGNRASVSDEPTPEPDFENAPPPPDPSSGGFISESPPRDQVTPTGPDPQADRPRGRETSQDQDGEDLSSAIVAPFVAVSERLEDAGVDRNVQIYGGLAAMVALVVGVGLGMMALGGGDTDRQGDTPEAIPNAKAGDSVASDQEESGSAGTITLPVSSIPQGAEVRVDGRLVGITPHSLSSLKIGETYEIKFSRNDYETVTKTLTPAPDTRPIVAELAKTDGVLRVLTFPSDARIEVDGEEVGYSPVTVPDLRTDEEHEVVATLEEGQTRRRTVGWSAGDESLKRVRLRFEDRDEEEDEQRARQRQYAQRRARARQRNRQPSHRSGSSSERSGSSSSDRPSGGSAGGSDDGSGGGPNLFGGGSSGGGSGSDDGVSQGGSQGGEGTGKDGSGNSTDLDIWSLGKDKKKGGGSSGGGGSGPTKGFLTVRVDGGTAKVYVDARLVKSKSPLIKHEVAPGMHRVKVYFPVLKRFSSEKKVRVSAGQTASVSFSP